MPIRTVLIFAGLFAVAVLVAVIAWAVGADICLVIPSRSFSMRSTPVRDPLATLGALAVCAIAFRYSQMGAIGLAAVLAASLVLGCFVCGSPPDPPLPCPFYYTRPFDWTSFTLQILLTVFFVADVVYGWMISDYYLDD
ncbi:MAG: hypothetical protein JW818_05320 [Pirellulales bacterium]|nr:hypothetical protein [Pirellulales bacterium]